MADARHAVPRRPPTMKAKKKKGRRPADPDLTSGPLQTDQDKSKGKGKGKSKGKGRGKGRGKGHGKGSDQRTPTPPTSPQTPKPKVKPSPAIKTPPPPTVKKTTQKKKHPNAPKSEALKKVWRETGKGCSKCRWFGKCRTCHERRVEYEAAKQRGEDLD